MNAVIMKRLGLGKVDARVREIVDVYRRGQQNTLPRQVRIVAAPLQILYLTAREMTRDQLPTKVASLSFFSVMSVIPLLSVATALLGAFNMFDPATGDLVNYMQTLFPEVGYEIVTYVNKFSMQGAASMGGIGAVTLLIISLFLFNNIEQTLTSIWQGGHNRPLMLKFLMFYTMVTLGPILIVMSIVQSASAQLFIAARLGLDAGFFTAFLPVVFAFALFTFMIKILPNALVTTNAAVLGGAVSAASFELAKWGFNQYVNLVLLDSYNNLYGALGLFPIFLLWVYVTWFVLLWGTELAFCFQHRESLLRTELGLGTFVKKNDAYTYHPFVCLEVLAPIASAYSAGGGALTEGNVVNMTGYKGDMVRAILDEMIRIKVLMVAGEGKGKNRRLTPQRPLTQIKLADVVSALQHVHLTDQGREVAALVRSYRAAIDQMLGEKTALELVDTGLVEEVRQQVASDVEQGAV